MKKREKKLKKREKKEQRKTTFSTSGKRRAEKTKMHPRSDIQDSGG